MTSVHGRVITYAGISASDAYVADEAPPSLLEVARANEARQILEAATSDTQTLQQRLQQLLRPFDPTVDKDW